MKLWLVRHAQPLIGGGICYGRLDMPADAAATAACARELAALLPAGLRLACSPLQRCDQLARALSALRPDLACKADDRLREMDFGAWEGRAWQDIAHAELQAWTDDFSGHAAGGHGESVAGFMARVASAFDALPGPQGAAGADAVWITHAGVIRAAGLLAQGIRHVERADQWPLDAPKYGQWRLVSLPAAAA